MYLSYIILIHFTLYLIIFIHHNNMNNQGIPINFVNFPLWTTMFDICLNKKDAFAFMSTMVSFININECLAESIKLQIKTRLVKNFNRPALSTSCPSCTKIVLTHYYNTYYTPIQVLYLYDYIQLSENGISNLNSIIKVVLSY